MIVIFHFIMHIISEYKLGVVNDNSCYLSEYLTLTSERMTSGIITVTLLVCLYKANENTTCPEFFLKL